MLRFLLLIFVECALLVIPLAGAQAKSPNEVDVAVGDAAPGDATAKTASPSGGLPALPPVPQGETTIVGGTIRNLDLVRDQFSLALYGQRPMKILFDERTEVYRDGVKIPLRELRPESHASVQTALDGSNIFAVSIHILSAMPEGECQGRVINYNEQSGELDVKVAISPKIVRLYVPASVPIERRGQLAFTSKSAGRGDLVPGALVSATFRPDRNSRDVARQVAILAIPGSSFVFAGTISHLDLSAGIFDLVDPQDGKSYEIHFSPTSAHVIEQMHIGGGVRVKAAYDGLQYQAAEISVR